MSAVREPSAPSAPRCGPWVLAASIGGSSMAFIDGTVVNVALPALQSSLGATVSQVQWTVESYALFLAALLLAGGSLGDLYGRRKIFTIGVIVFAIASAWCGMAPTIGQLIAARALQGVGGALVVPGSLALLSASFPPELRGRAIGTWSAFTAVTTAIGPVFGGWLIEHKSWRWAFFVNLPLALLVLVITALRVPESRSADKSRPRPDWPGAFLATLALGGIVLALIEPRFAIPAACAGIAALVAFLVVEARTPYPMLPFTLFHSHDFSGANLLTLFLYAALSGVLFVLPLNLIQIQGYSATQAGAVLLPFVVLLFALSRWSGGLVARYGGRRPLIIGPLIAAVGFALFAVLPANASSYWTGLFPAVLVLGSGMAVTVAPLTTVVMTSIGEDHAGTASGINNAVSRIAGLLAVAILGLALITTFNHTLDGRLAALKLPEAERHAVDVQRSKLAAVQTANPAVHSAVAESFLAGYRMVLWIATGLSAASSVTAMLLIGRTRLRGER